MQRCRKCGYFDDVHDVITTQCPVCACGEVPAAHDSLERRCPALCMICANDPAYVMPHEHRPYRIGEKGDALTLRRGKFEPAAEGPMPIDERIARIVGRITRNLPPVVVANTIAEEEIVTGPPMVPARRPRGAHEIAGYGGRQAVGLGLAGQRAGWTPTALYWRAADGEEGCGVWLLRDDLRALATWKRPSAKAGTKSGWSADLAYGWRVGSGQFPYKITHTALDGLIDKVR